MKPLGDGTRPAKGEDNAVLRVALNGLVASRT